MNVVLRDAAPAIAAIVGVSDGRIKAAAAAFRKAGRFPRSQGLALPLSNRHLSLLLIAAFVGPSADRVLAYAAAETSTGQRLVDALALAFDSTALLERLQIDTDEPAALLITSGGDCRYFGLPGPGARFAVLDGDAFGHLVDRLKSIPPRRAGRPFSRQ